MAPNECRSRPLAIPWSTYLLVDAAMEIKLEATTESSGTRRPQLRLRACRDRDWIRVEVVDNGPGIPEDARKRIFEPFYTTKPVGKGTGLGLSVSYMIVTNNHSGTLEVESVPDEGAEFILRLPIKAGSHGSDENPGPTGGRRGTAAA